LGAERLQKKLGGVLATGDWFLAAALPSFAANRKQKV
jgi:hypothetical protein